MFKVPDWGTDVPDSNVKFAKSTKKKKEKKASILVTQESPVKTQVNGITQKKQNAKKSTDKRRLKKIRQKNRELYQKLSNPQNNEAESNSNNHTGRFVLNPNKAIMENKPGNVQKIDIVNNIKHEKLKPKPNKFEKQKNKYLKSINALNETNGTEMKKPKKRKPYNDHTISNIELNNVDTDKADELIINAKKNKLMKAFKNEDQEEILFGEKPIEKPKVKFDPKKDGDQEEILFGEKPIEKPKVKFDPKKDGDQKEILFGEKPIEKPKVKFDPKKDKIRKLLEQNNNRNSINVSGNSNSLRERMLAKLQAAQFRYLNEKLYTSSGTEAQQLFKSDPAAFQTYHQGYQLQIKKWPVNPLDIIVKRIMKMPKNHTIADMGCGSATLSRRIPHKVRSFDLVASAPGVEPCDMAHTPLLSQSVDVVVYCLALMGTQLAEYLAEGNRVLKTGGHLLIAEVESRFEKLEDFTRGVERLGFKLLKTDQSHKVFYFLEFKKLQEASKKARHVPLTLKPCLYKRR